MRFLFDCHTFDTKPQGTTTLVRGLLNELPTAAEAAGLGGDLEIYCASADRHTMEHALTIPFHHIPIRTGFINRNLVELPRAAKRINADLVVSQYVRPIWVPKASLSFIHDLLFLDFPTHFSWTYRVARTALFGLSARTSTRVMTISKYSKQRIVDTYNLDPDKISIMPCACPRTEVIAEEPAGAGDLSINLLYIARLEPRKRQEWCLRLLADLVQSGMNLSLTLVGTGVGPYAEGIKAQIAALPSGLRKRVRHAESISDEELNRIIAKADLFIYPSLGEGFGIPVLEASTAGLPCVVADGTSLAELTPYFAGSSFASGDYSGFLAATRNVSENLGVFKARALALRETIFEVFNWRKSADLFLEVALGAIRESESDDHHSKS